MVFLHFIVSSKFLRADYGKKLTTYLQQNFTILELIDFGDLQIFEGATTYPCIITIQKKKPTGKQDVEFLKLSSLDAVADLSMALKKDGHFVEINKDDERWHLRGLGENKVFSKLTNGTVPLGEYVDEHIYYGIKTGLNEAFVIDTSNEKDDVNKHAKKQVANKAIIARERYQKIFLYVGEIMADFYKEGSRN